MSQDPGVFRTGAHQLGIHRVSEPTPGFMHQPPLVVDCSALAGILFQENWQFEALQQLAGRSLHAPYLLEIEFASVALKKLRQGHRAMATAALEKFAEFQVTLHPVHIGEVALLAQRYQLSVYDACYLWLAAELNTGLATFDKKLAGAAQEHL